jgi:hypothetical protein
VLYLSSKFFFNSLSSQYNWGSGSMIYRVECDAVEFGGLLSSRSSANWDQSHLQCMPNESSLDHLEAMTKNPDSPDHNLDKNANEQSY